MKLTVQLQLLPDAEQAQRLRETVERFNAAADWLAGVAFQRQLSNKFVLQKLAYAELRQRFALPADTAIRCIAQVVEAYKRDKAKRPHFRPHAAVPFSMDRNIGFKDGDRVSIATLSGRVIVPSIMGQYQRQQFGFPKGQADLLLRQDGKWFLLVTIDIPEGTPLAPTDFIGVDMGVVNIATDSDGGQESSAKSEEVRQRYARRRRTLDRAAAGRKRRGKRPKSIRRAKLRHQQKEARFRRDINHQISKRLVASAKDTHRGIALEDLKGIRARTRFRKQQRPRMLSWSFAQLRLFIEYKAQRAGVTVVAVHPAYTSRTCSQCGHCEKANRQSQSVFECRSCGVKLHADLNAARTIRLRARAAVNLPMVSEKHGINSLA